MSKQIQRTDRARTDALGDGSTRSAFGRPFAALGKVLAFCLMLCVALAASAQSITGDIVASVTDTSGAFIPSASLTLTEVNTGQVITLPSNNSGLGTFSSLKPGTYRLVAKAAGFETTQLDDITVVIGLERVPSLKQGEAFATMNEVFYMRGEGSFGQAQESSRRAG